MVHGSLLLIGAVVVARSIPTLGWAGWGFVIAAAANAIGNVAVGAFRSGSHWHVVGAGLAIVGGNVAAIIAGLGSRRLGASRSYRLVSVAIGVVGQQRPVVHNNALSGGVRGAEVTRRQFALHGTEFGGTDGRVGSATGIRGKATGETSDAPGAGDRVSDPSLTAEPHCDILLPHADASLPVADLGCGNGTQTRHLATRFARAIGVDLSHAAIEHARRADTEKVAEFEQLSLVDDVLGAVGAVGDTHAYMRAVIHQRANRRTGLLSPGRSPRCSVSAAGSSAVS